MYTLPNIAGWIDPRRISWARYAVRMGKWKMVVKFWPEKLK